MVICLISLKSFGYPDEIQFSGSISGSVQSIYSTPNDRFILGISDTASSISVFDALLFEQVASYSVGNTPYDMTISDDGLKAFLVTSRTDNIVALDISDPENITESTAYDLSTGSVTFGKIEGISVSGDLYLFVTDPANNNIYVYNATQEILVDSPNNPISLSFSPVDIDISPDGATISALGENGEFIVYSTSDFSQITSLIDVVSGDADFIKLEHATVSLGEVAFLLNSNSTGEIYLIAMSDKLNDNIGIIDADPTGGGSSDPIIVGNGASEISLVSVTNPDSTYIYSSSPGESAIKVTDTAGIGDGSTKIEPLATISNAGNVSAGGITAGPSQDGYLYAASSTEQKINILSENPVVTLVTPAGNANIESGSITVTFKPDSAGTYSLTNFTGSPQDGVSSSVGTTLKSGSHSADEEVSVDVSVNELTQGDNFISFFAVTGNFTGRKAVKIIYDTVPAKPENFSIEFGNQRLICSWERSSETDIDYYNIYFGTSADNLSGANGISSPIQVDHPDSGTKVTYTIEPLINGVEIFLQATAVDQNGNESERTDLISDTPEQTVGPLGLSGERGCGAVQNINKNTLFMVLILGLIILLFIKRRKSVLLIIPLLLIAPSISFPQENPDEQITITTPEEKTQTSEDIDPANSLTPPEQDYHEMKIKDFMSGSFQVSWFMPKNQILRDFYGIKGNETYTLRNSYFIWLFEVGLEVGFFWESARMIGETTGRQSGERVKMFMMPLSFPVIFNGRIWSSQIFVPYMKFGYSFLYYRIKEPDDSINGVTNRFMIGGGLKFNFEGFTGEGQSIDVGINHMFLFFEWLYYHNFKSGGLTFSGNNWGFGVGVDY